MITEVRRKNVMLRLMIACIIGGELFRWGFATDVPLIEYSVVYLTSLALPIVATPGPITDLNMAVALLIAIPILLLPPVIAIRFGRWGFFACATSLFCGFALVDGIMGDSLLTIILAILVVIPGYFAAYIGEKY
jgi:hypothetical protein